MWQFIFSYCLFLLFVLILELLQEKERYSSFQSKVSCTPTKFRAAGTEQSLYCRDGNDRMEEAACVWESERGSEAHFSARLLLPSLFLSLRKKLEGKKKKTKQKKNSRTKVQKQDWGKTKSVFKKIICEKKKSQKMERRTYEVRSSTCSEPLRLLRRHPQERTRLRCNVHTPLETHIDWLTRTVRCVTHQLHEWALLNSSWW